MKFTMRKLSDICGDYIGQNLTAKCFDMQLD